MTSSLTLRVRGLVESHELAEAPGALTVATDVVVEPGGTILGRPTFSLDQDVNANSPHTLIRYGGAWGCVYYDSGIPDDVLWISGTGPVTGHVTPPFGAFESPWWSQRLSLYLSTSLGVKKLASSGDSALADAGFDVVLVWNPLILTSSGIGAEAPAFTGLVAYRICVRRKDANGYVARSKPSDRWPTDGNCIGGTSLDEGASTGIFRYLFTGLREGDVVEWYRTRGSGSSAVPPAASHYLVCEYQISAYDISNGYFYNPRRFDTLADDELGAALYTNPERDGIEKAKEPPPIGGCAAVFGRCSWLGNTIGKQRASTSLRAVGRVYALSGNITSGSPNITNVASLPASAASMVGWYVCDSQTTPRSNGTSIVRGTRILAVTGAGPYTVQMSANATATVVGQAFGLTDWYDPSLLVVDHLRGTFTAGSSIITNVANVTGLTGKMYLVDDTNTRGPAHAGTYIPAETKIVAVSGPGPYTIQMSNNALASGTMDLTASDFVTIAGKDFYAANFTDFVSSVSPRNTRCFLLDATAGRTVMYLAMAVARAAKEGEVSVRLIRTGEEDAFGASSSGDFTVEEIGLGGGSFTLTCTNSSTAPTAFRPPFPTIPFGVGTIESSNDAHTNRIAWSAPDEPEAWPLVNYVDLATNSARVMRLVPLRSSMLVFTSEGLYRVSGVAPDAWSVDLIDPSLVLLSSSAVDVIDNVAVAWTTRGVVQVDESGFTDISTGAIGKRLEQYERGMYTDRCWVTTWKDEHLVLVGATGESLHGGESMGGSYALNNETAEVFSFHTVSRAWTSWDMQVRRAITIPSDNGAGDSLLTVRGSQFVSTKSDVVAKGYDLAHTISTWTHTTGTTLITIGAGFLGLWRPKAGDYLRLTIGGVDVYRRIVSVTTGLLRFITLSRATPVGSCTAVEAIEVAEMDIEWAPMSAGSVPGAHARWREATVVLDVTDRDYDDLTIPTEIEPGFGASSGMVEPAQLSRKVVTVPRTRILPLRFGMPRDVARAMTIWPRFKCGFVGFRGRVMSASMHRTDANERVHR